MQFFEKIGGFRLFGPQEGLKIFAFLLDLEPAPGCIIFLSSESLFRISPHALGQVFSGGLRAAPAGAVPPWGVTKTPPGRFFGGGGGKEKGRRDGNGPIADVYRSGELSALPRPKGRLTAAFRGHGPWGLWPQGPVTGAVRAKHPTGVYLRGSRLQGGSLDPFGTVTYASPNGATPLRARGLRPAFEKA